MGDIARYCGRACRAHVRCFVAAIAARVVDVTATARDAAAGSHCLKENGEYSYRNEANSDPEQYCLPDAHVSFLVHLFHTFTVLGNNERKEDIICLGISALPCSRRSRVRR